MGQLERNESLKGIRYVLDGRTVRVDERLELLVAGDVWLLGRCAWDPHLRFAPPLFHFLLGPAPTNGEKRPEVFVRLPPEAMLRWPSGS